jgi:hypothetical protein
MHADNVPAGDVTVVAEMIGFSRSSQTVRGSAGGSATLNIEVSERAIALGEIVVTGSAAAAEKRTMGNSIVSVNAAQLVERMPVKSVDELLLSC